MVSLEVVRLDIKKNVQPVNSPKYTEKSPSYVFFSLCLQFSPCLGKQVFPDLYFLCARVQSWKHPPVLMHLKELPSWSSCMLCTYICVWARCDVLIKNLYEEQQSYWESLLHPRFSLTIELSVSTSSAAFYPAPLFSSCFSHGGHKVLCVLPCISHTIYWKILSFNFHSIPVNHELNQMRPLWHSTEWIYNSWWGGPSFSPVLF